jgi:hypothetical protein
MSFFVSKFLGEFPRAGQNLLAFCCQIECVFVPILAFWCASAIPANQQYFSHMPLRRRRLEAKMEAGLGGT